MEILGLVNVPAWLILVVTFILTVCLYTWYKQSYFKRLGIPTKDTIFFFGEFIEMCKKGFACQIDADMVKTNGKVFGMYTGNIPTLVISDPDILKQILVKDFQKFTDRSNLIPLEKQWHDSVALASGSHWKFLRSTLSPTFTTGKIRKMGFHIQRCLDNLHIVLDEIAAENQDGIDIEKILKGYTMDIICSTGFGFEAKTTGNPDSPLLKFANEFGNPQFGWSGLLIPLKFFFPDVSFIVNWKPINMISNAAYDFLKNMIISAFENRRGSVVKHNDLLGLLMNAHKSDLDFEGVQFDVKNDTSQDASKKRSLTDQEVLMNSMIFMSAGFDALALTISWLIYDMVTNPECQDRLWEEIDNEIGNEEPTYDAVFKMNYLDMAMSETLRMHPPGSRLNREAVEDVEIGGIKIEKGMDCTFSTLALHYLPEYWPNPTQYDPERFSPEKKKTINEYAYMPFGHGPRNCIGMRLALFEAKMTVVSLVQKYRFHKTAKLQVPMPLSKLPNLRPAKPIYIRLEKRDQSK